MALKVTFLFVCFYALFSPLCAQVNAGTITGMVIDVKKGRPLKSALIQISAVNDSIVNSNTITDKKGKFEIAGIAKGDYRLTVSYVGYETLTKEITIKLGKTKLGIISIRVLPNTLNEVIVTTKKPIFTTEIDRKVYDVDQDIMAQTGSASDVLKNVPSVEVDIDGNVSLRGSGNVAIFINGRPSLLMGKTRAEVLQQFPANTIDRIEIITNPSARYRPDGTSGIINIILKKNRLTSLNGSVLFNVGTNNRQNGTINLSFKKNSLNFFTSYGIRRYTRLRYGDTYRETKGSSANITGYYTENEISTSDPLSHFVSVGSEYVVGKNLFSASGNYYVGNQVRENVAEKIFYNEFKTIESAFTRYRYDPEKENQYEAVVNWQRSLNRNDEELVAEFSTSSSTESDYNQFINRYRVPNRADSRENSITGELENQQQFSIDYTLPLAEGGKIEAGYSAIFSQIKLDFLGEYYDEGLGKFVLDTGRTNLYHYRDAIHALYGTWQRKFDKFGVSAGLRGERAIIKGKLLSKNIDFDNSYFNIYPTVHLTLQTGKSEWQLNYSKRVNRPDGDDLNPFSAYQDPQNIRVGNPGLLPEIIHSAELGYKWDSKIFTLVPSLYYRYEKNGFTSVTVPLNDSVLITTEQNLSNDQSVGLELVTTINTKKFFNANISTNIFNNRIDATGLGYNEPKSVLSMSANGNINFTLWPNTRLQLSFYYRSARLTPQGKRNARFVMNTGIRQDLFKKKLSLVLTVSDILKTYNYRSVINTPYLNQVYTGRRDARVFYFGASYRFGKTAKKEKGGKMEFDNNL